MLTSDNRLIWIDHSEMEAVSEKGKSGNVTFSTGVEVSVDDQLVDVQWNEDTNEIKLVMATQQVPFL